MSDTKISLEFGNIEIILIGTAHVSRESIEEVRSSILEINPQCVCVELDKARFASITNKDSWEKLDMVKMFREGKGFLLIANLVLSGFQRRMGAELGVKPGEEMITALNTAAESGIPHSLCDRDVHITLRRAWSRCNFWNKSKLLASLLAGAFTTEKITQEEIENLKKHSEIDGMMAELAEYLPQVKKTLIDERDRYLAAKIWEASGQDKVTQDASCGPKKIIAVVGAGHMQGIKNHLEKIYSGQENINTADLDTIPPPSFLSMASRFIIPAFIVVLIVLGFLHSGIGASLSMIKYWILWNGGLAAIGAIIALGHPLAVLVSLLGAPFTSVSPFIGIGILSGITQAVLRKPRVIDAQNILRDTGSLKGIYKNRITHTLLVFMLSSLGSVAGSFISIPFVTDILLK